MKPWMMLVFLAAVVLVGCVSGTENRIVVTSPAFKDHAIIPEKYSCAGQDKSPPLEIAVVPEGTKSLAIIVTDPDAPAGEFVHWTAWNIPVTSRIPEGSLPQGAVEGTNDFGSIGYGGPCPPPGSVHKYMFRVYALDTTINLPMGAGKTELEKAMEGHVLAEGKLVGIYSRTA